MCWLNSVVIGLSVIEAAFSAVRFPVFLNSLLVILSRLNVGVWFAQSAQIDIREFTFCGEIVAYILKSSCGTSKALKRAV